MSIDPRPLLFILILIHLSCKTAKKAGMNDIEIVEELSKNDHSLSSPKKGEWLFDHDEPGQSFAQYKSDQPVMPDSIRRKLYLQPLGQFSKVQENIIKYTAEYLTLFFGLKTIVMPVIHDTIIPPGARRIREGGSIQLFAPYILDTILKKSIPANAIALMAITGKDLFHDPSWNFVFGLASLKERVGVSSIYRYSEQPIDSLNYPLCLSRLINTASHEIGHMFSARHCTNAICVMNGSNSLPESDTKPNRLCSECLSKLQWNIGFDVKNRTKLLAKFFEDHRLASDYLLIQADLALMK